MADRELYWGAADDAATEYRTRDSDPAGGGDFIVAERSDGSGVLLVWDDTAGEWQTGGPVNLEGDDLANVGALDAASVESGEYTVGAATALIDVAASGEVALTDGTATVDTGLSAIDATFYLALGIDDPDADADVAGKLIWDNTAGTYQVTIEEVDSSVNPTVNYDILRVR